LQSHRRWITQQTRLLRSTRTSARTNRSNRGANSLYRPPPGVKYLSNPTTSGVKARLRYLYGLGSML
jgi:hypothetical protein